MLGMEKRVYTIDNESFDGEVFERGDMKECYDIFYTGPVEEGSPTERGKKKFLKEYLKKDDSLPSYIVGDFSDEINEYILEQREVFRKNKDRYMEAFNKYSGKMVDEHPIFTVLTTFLSGMGICIAVPGDISVPLGLGVSSGFLGSSFLENPVGYIYGKKFDKASENFRKMFTIIDEKHD